MPSILLTSSTAQADLASYGITVEDAAFLSEGWTSDVSIMPARMQFPAPLVSLMVHYTLPKFGGGGRLDAWNAEGAVESKEFDVAFPMIPCDSGECFGPPETITGSYTFANQNITELRLSRQTPLQDAIGLLLSAVAFEFAADQARTATMNLTE